MSAWLWGVLLAPAGALLIFGGVALPIKWVIATLMPDGWLKRQILAERFKSKCSASNRAVIAQASRHPNGWRDPLGKTIVLEAPRREQRKQPAEPGKPEQWS